MQRSISYSLYALLFFSFISCRQQMESKLGIENPSALFPELTGNYLGQQLPDSLAILFAPEIVSDGLNNRDIAIMPNGQELYFSVSLGPYACIFYSFIEDGMWVKPQIASFSSDKSYMTIEPFISLDGKQFYFASDRPISSGGEKKDFNLWVMDRTDGEWSSPRLLESEINSEEGEFFPSLTKQGRLYFTRSSPTGENFILRTAFLSGQFQAPELLPKQVNCGKDRFNAFISPDEDFIIVPAVGMEDCYGGADYYISFRSQEDQWSEPINMGTAINSTAYREWSASLSADGKMLFFMSNKGQPEESQPSHLTADYLKEMQSKPQNGNSDIYWLKSDFIQDLRKNAVWVND